MNVQLSTFDPTLPGLATALDATAMGERMDALLGSTDSPWRVVDVEVIKHKPGRRCALAYTVEIGETRRLLFAKTFRNDRGAIIFVNMAKFARAVARETLVLPRPFGYLPDIKLLVTEFLEGKALATEMYGDRPDETARRMAAAIAAFHACGVACARRWGPSKELRNTEEWLIGQSGRSPVAASRARVLLRIAESLSRGLPDVLPCPIHRDFYAEQLWKCGNRVGLLDLDDVRSGDPAVDVANFLAHLKLRALQFPGAQAACRRAHGAFIEAYRERSSGGECLSWNQRVCFYEATALLRLSGVYAARRRWADSLPPKLLDACESVIESGA